MVSLEGYKRDCIDAFKMEFSKEDIKNNKEVKKLAKTINNQIKYIDKILILAFKYNLRYSISIIDGQYNL